MEQDEQHHLFDSKLNASGRMYIRKFATATRILLVTGILASIVFLTASIIRTLKIDFSLFSDNKLARFYLRIFPLYSLVYSVLLSLQLFYYWKVGKGLLKGVDYNDETEFNDAFMALYRNAVLGIISLSTAFLMSLLDLYLAAKYSI